MIKDVLFTSKTVMLPKPLLCRPVDKVGGYILVTNVPGAIVVKAFSKGQA
jgi:hypothetical protein